MLFRSIDEFINSIPGNGRFLYSSFQNYTNLDIISFLKQQNVEVKEERGNRIFPISDKSVDVLNAFIKKLKSENVKVITNSKVKEILCIDNEEKKKVIGVLLENGQKKLADKVIIATGGKSYPDTGSTGDGYEMIKKVGHTIQKLKPSLVPLVANEQSLKICKEMQGLSLKNVGIFLKDEENNKNIYEDFGEMLFTHFGVSGPTILSSSAHLLRYKDIEQKIKKIGRASCRERV